MKTKFNPRQMVLSQVIQQQVNNFGDATEKESRTENLSSKVACSQKIAVDAVAKEMGITRSDLQVMAIEFFFAFIGHHQAMIDNKEIILPIISRMK